LCVEVLEDRRLLTANLLDTFDEVGEGEVGSDSSQIAAPVIDVGKHVLLPDTPNQMVPIHVAGGQLTQGVVFNIQIGDGYPDVPGSMDDGPNIAGVSLVEPGSVFGGVANTGNNPIETRGQIWVVGTSTSSGTVPAEGILANVTIDTTGWFGGDGPWELRLARTFSGDTNFQSPSGQFVPTITGGSIDIEAAKRWHSVKKPTDVNGDGLISRADARDVINAVNTHGSIELPTMPTGSLAALPYVDTNNDGWLSPSDALLVINRINGQLQRSGEGEANNSLRSAATTEQTWLPGTPSSGLLSDTMALAASHNTALTDLVLAGFTDDMPFEAADAIADACHSRGTRANTDLTTASAIGERERADPPAIELGVDLTLLDSVLPVIAEGARQWPGY